MWLSWFGAMGGLGLRWPHPWEALFEKDDGLEDTVAPNDLFDEEHREHASALWHLSDGTTSQQGRWAASA